MDRILQYCRLLKAKKMLQCYEYNIAKYKIQTADIELSFMEVSKNIWISFMYDFYHQKFN